MKSPQHDNWYLLQGAVALAIWRKLSQFWIIIREIFEPIYYIIQIWSADWSQVQGFDHKQQNCFVCPVLGCDECADLTS